MAVDTPVGKLEIRKCDHQLVLPMYYGATKKDPKYDFLVATDIETIPGKDYMPSCDEITKLRKK
jgi:branched-chain amino acid transport system substrate-binding protein